MSIAAPKPDNSTPVRALPKPALSVSGAVAIVAGIVIGGGIFAFPPLIAQMAGSTDWMFIVWLFGAALTLVGAMCYAELAAAFPSTGGDYHFLTRAYGKDVSFFFGWARATVIITGSIALLAFVFGDYMSRVFSLGPNSSAVYAALVVVVLSAVNIAGLHKSSRTQVVLVILEITGLLSVVVAGIVAPASPADVTSSRVDVGMSSALGSALLFVLFAYGGWNEGAYVSAEIKGGARAVQRALVIAIALVTAVYLAFVWALWHGLGFEGLAASKAVAADVAARAFGATGEKIVAAVVAISALTSINASMIVGARTNYSIANDWPIVRFMSRWDGIRHAPVAAFVVQGTIALLLVIFAAFEQDGVRTMVEFTAPVFWFFFMLSGIAVMVLRFRYPHTPRPFKVPLYPVLPLIFVCTSAYLFYRGVTHAQSQNAVHIALYVMAAGLAAWAIARLYNLRRRAAELNRAS
jgi:basic amino acid/polyamine antiporter, APA family